MRWYAVLESMKSESSTHGQVNASFFPHRRVFSFFFPQEANKCFPFIIIYYFARHSYIACIMLLKPMLARSPRWNKKMLAPHVVDIAVIIFTTFHICRTIRRHFSLRQIKLCIGQRKYKQTFTSQGRKEWPGDPASESGLAQLTPISHSAK